MMVNKVHCQAVSRQPGFCVHGIRALPQFHRGALLVSAAWRKKEEPSDFVLSASICPVPRDQQPMYELKRLQDSFLADWATMPLPAFLARLAAVYLVFFLTLGLPVSAVTFDLTKEPLQCLLASCVGSSFIVTVLMFRLYLGWEHVGSRLLSATVEYEETGWYDGQVWVKSPAVLMKERLMGAYTVRPAINRMKTTLLGLAGTMAGAIVTLAVLPPPSVNSAPADFGYYDRVVVTPVMEYSERVKAYEPWAAEGEEEEEGEDVMERGSMMGHMQ